MAKGGGSGPTRGGYFQIHFATQTLSTPTTSAGVTLGTWTVPTGARFNIMDVQAFAEYSGTASVTSHVGRVNVFQGSTSVLSSEISLASGSSTAGTLTASVVPVSSAVVLSATGSAGFGTGAAASNAQHVTVKILGFLSEHPNSISGNFGYADPTSQPNFGP